LKTLDKKLALSRFLIYGVLAAKKDTRTLVFFSGGKDSLVMTDIICTVVDEENLRCPDFVVGDPFPFDETVKYIERIMDDYGVKNYTFWHELIKDADEVNEEWVSKNRFECCKRYKIDMMKDIIRSKDYEVVFVGIRADEHPSRSGAGYIRIEQDPVHVRVHPLFEWTLRDVWEYIVANKLEVNPLYYRGYMSIGCRYCTFKNAPEFNDVTEIFDYVVRGINERSGRAQDKEEIMDRLRALGYF